MTSPPAGPVAAGDELVDEHQVVELPDAAAGPLPVRTPVPLTPARSGWGRSVDVGGSDSAELSDPPDSRGSGRVDELVASWLLSKRSAGTRSAYASDAAAWLAYCRASGLDPLHGVRRVHVDAWARAGEAAGLAPATVARRLSAVSSWYAWLVVDELVARNPAAHVTRPVVDLDDTRALGLTPAQVRALLAAADHDTDHRADPRRNAAILAVLLFGCLRVSELVGADVGDLVAVRGHRALQVLRKGGRRRTVALPAPALDRLDDYLAHRGDLEFLPALPGQVRAGARPLIATATGARMRRGNVWRLVRRLAALAGDELADVADRIGPHSLRHTAITSALDAGASLRDVQDWADHADPRTTRRYDRARHRLDSTPGYALAHLVQ